MNRRNFIKSGTLAASSFMLPFSLQTTPTKIKLGIVGTGSWGTEVTLKSAMASGQFEIVGLCDVNAVALNRAAEEVVKRGGKKPKLFSSYQALYELPKLEAVAIATPTHWHALQFIDACKKGLHVYLEKPVCYDIREGQAMLEAHRRVNTVVQVDFPRMKGTVNQEVKSFIQSGEAGKILQVQAVINHHEGPLMEKPVPAGFDFETFCGPAPQLQYLCDEHATIPMWRGQHDFSRGILFDWGIHYIHNARKVLDLGLPDSVSAAGGITRNFTHSNTDHLEVRYDFAGLPVGWSHKTWGYTSPMPDNDYGMYYYGEKATIFAGDMGWEVYPANGGARIKHGEVRFNPGEPTVWQKYLQMAVDLLTEFAEQIRDHSNEGITNTLEDAYITTASVIYADMAYLVQAGLQFDKSTMTVKNHEKANGLLKREYREPFQHPYISS